MTRFLRKILLPGLRCLVVMVMLATFGLTSLASALGFEQVPQLKKSRLEPATSSLDQMGAAGATGDAGKMAPKPKPTEGREISVIASGTSRADNDSGRLNRKYVWDCTVLQIRTDRTSFVPILPTVALTSPELARAGTLVGAHPSGTM